MEKKKKKEMFPKKGTQFAIPQSSTMGSRFSLLYSVNSATIRREILKARTEDMNRAMGDLMGRMKQDQVLYRRVMEEALIQEIRSGQEEIIVSPEDRHLMNEDFLSLLNHRAEEKLGHPTDITLSSETRCTGGGCFLREGTWECNVTLERVVRTVRQQYQLDMIRTFFRENQ